CTKPNCYCITFPFPQNDRTNLLVHIKQPFLYVKFFCLIVQGWLDWTSIIQFLLLKSHLQDQEPLVYFLQGSLVVLLYLMYELSCYLVFVLSPMIYAYYFFY